MNLLSFYIIRCRDINLKQKLKRRDRKTNQQGEAKRASDAGNSARVLLDVPNSKKDKNSWRKVPRERKQENSFSKGRLLAKFLPLILIVMGTSIAAFQPWGVIGSVVTTMLTALFVYYHEQLRAKKSENSLLQVEAMKNRFETLEDRAWELRESEERYRNIAESFGDMLVIRRQTASGDGEIIYCNNEYANCFSKQVDELIGTKFSPTFENVENEDFSNVNSVEKTETTQIKAYETKLGKRWFSWLDLAVRDEKHGVMSLSVARDITAFKLAEKNMEHARQKAEAANQAKSRFLAMVSHEMRTPLNGILGMSNLLSGTKLTKEQKTYVDAVNGSGTSLLELIEEMLDLTLIEAGKFELREEEFDLRENLNEIIELVSAKAYSKDIGIGLFVDSKIPKRFVSDPKRFRQILLNLVGNAIKFTQTGGVALQVFLEKNESDGALLRFDVIDTGPGLSKKDQLRIFKEFERVDEDTTRKVDGAGLGLAISNALAKQFGANIRISKSSKKGSVFELTIKLKEVEKVDRELSIDDIPTPLTQKITLLASANVMESDCLSRYITASGGKVLHAKNSSELNKILKVNPKFEDIIFDPVFSNQIAAISDVKKIILLEPAKRQNLDDQLEHDFDAYLIRPVRLESLLAVLTNDENHLSEDANSLKYEKQNKEIPNVHAGLKKLEGCKILLAEDNPINTLLVTAALEKAGAKVVHADDGKIAVDLFMQDQFNLVLMDMHMPHLDGISATKKIRAHENKMGINANVPIIALSADNQTSTKKTAKLSGIDEFLTKPIDPANLVEKVVELQN